MSSRLLVAARQAAARLAGNCRSAGSLTSRGFSINQYFATLKNEIMHPEIRPENMG